MAHKNEIELRRTPPIKTVVAGAAVGAFAGLIAAMLLHRRAVKSERDSMLTISEGLKLGLLIFGLLRAINALGDDD